MSLARVLVTGAGGLIGSQLLRRSSGAARAIDLRPVSHEGVNLERCSIDELGKPGRLGDALAGIVHLAGVSRVVDGQRDPRECWRSNVIATQNLVDAASQLEDPPWIIYASSREVYGQPATLPATEDIAIQPCNVYGRSKAAAERIIQQYHERTGRPGQILRFSNVFGHPKDYPDRVVPAFVLAGLANQPMRLDGRDSGFDFTHVSDAAAAIEAASRLAAAGECHDPIHVVSGHMTTLSQMAALVQDHTGSSAPYVEAPPRSYDVPRFVGDPTRCQDLLGFTPRPIQDAIGETVQAFREAIECAVC